MPFSEKRDLHLFVRFIYVTLSRAHLADLHLFIWMFIRRHFNPFSVSLCRYLFPLFLPIFIFCSRCSPLQKRELYGLSNETPDRYRRVSRDNSFFYHGGTTAVACVKRSRQHIHATRNCLFFVFQRYVSLESFEQKYSFVAYKFIFVSKISLYASCKIESLSFSIFQRLAIFTHYPVASKYKNKEFKVHIVFDILYRIAFSYFVCPQHKLNYKIQCKHIKYRLAKTAIKVWCNLGPVWNVNIAYFPIVRPPSR